jgi:hypothetical protein
MRRRHSVIAALVVGSAFVLSSFSQTPKPPAQAQGNFLVEFLRSYVGGSTEEKKTTRYSTATVDLRDNGTQEVIVYLTSDGWCGTGGCTLLILAPEGTSYRVVTRIPAVRLPIRVLATRSRGWHDLSVVAGKPLHQAALAFDGKTYPSNASVPPAHPLSEEVRGETVMPATVEDNPLYQDTVDPKNGNLRVQIPVVTGAKPKP